MGVPRVEVFDTMLSGWQRIGVLLTVGCSPIVWIAASNEISNDAAYLGSLEHTRVYEGCLHEVDAAYEKQWSKNTTLMPTDRPDYSAFIATRVKCAEPAAQAWKTAAKAHEDSRRGQASLVALAATLGVLGSLWLTIWIGRWVRRGFQQDK